MLVFCTAVFGQKTDELLATAGNIKFTPDSLSPEIQKVWNGQKAILAEARTQLLGQMIASSLLEAEAADQKTTADSLLDAVAKKVADPTPEQIKAVYDANQAQLGGTSLETATPQIVAYLRREPEEKAIAEYLESLKAKHKFAPGKDVNAPSLSPLETLYTVAGKPLSSQQFETKNKAAIADIKADIGDEIADDLELVVFSALIEAEADAKGVEPSAIIASEITDKLKDYTDEERIELQNALKRTLFAKYKPVFIFKAPQPEPMNISVDDDPAQGRSGAPVTVVMFSDFQCPACAGTHPILKAVLGEYGDKVRLVVRDYPLEKMHDNAFLAAAAANAANAQGKYFEYIDVLYRNQKQLDRASLLRYAKELGLNVKQFEIDLTSEKNAAEIRKDAADGNAYGITGTPTIYINGVKVRRLTADSFRKAIDRALAAAK